MKFEKHFSQQEVGQMAQYLRELAQKERSQGNSVSAREMESQAEELIDKLCISF